MNTERNVGIYIHIPFCNGKCPYCDFYSLPNSDNEELKDRYTHALINDIYSYENQNITADTLYFGGGTPNLLGKERLVSIINSVYDVFGKPDEITVEVNPSSDLKEFFPVMAKAGVNRISVGMQSAMDSELLLLGRKHTFEDVKKTVGFIKNSGIPNFSVDVMVGIPGQTKDSLRKTLDSAFSLEPYHISAYLLKIEEGTPFYKIKDTLDIADEDMTAELYEFLSEHLAKNGYNRYEISNFCRDNAVSHHNLKYWHCEEYLGFGAAAHSFFNGRRFYRPRDIIEYINGKLPIDDGEGGDFEEYAMLALRLSEGICNSDCVHRFGYPLPDGIKQMAKELEKGGFVTFDGEKIVLTTKGILVSNTVIGKLIGENY